MPKILVVNVNWLGDAVFSTAAFAALKRANPKAHVACLCVPRVAEVMARCPDVDEVIVYDEKGKDRWLWSQIALVMKLRRQHFALAVLLHGSASRAFLVYLAGIPQRIGLTKAGRWLTHPAPIAPEAQHRVDHYLSALDQAGVSGSQAPLCRLCVDPEDVKRLAGKLQDLKVAPGERLVVFHAGGNWNLKRWPVNHWAALARRVTEESSYRVIFSGGAQEKDLVDSITRRVPATVNCAGLTTLGETLALYQRAAVVVSGDSGPLHLASGIGAKVVGVFGPTRPEITGPRGAGEREIVFNAVGCNQAPCYHLSCLTNVCMNSIGVTDVWKALQRFLAQ